MARESQEMRDLKKHLADVNRELKKLAKTTEDVNEEERERLEMTKESIEAQIETRQRWDTAMGGAKAAGMVAMRGLADPRMTQSEIASQMGGEVGGAIGGLVPGVSPEFGRFVGRIGPDASAKLAEALGPVGEPVGVVSGLIGTARDAVTPATGAMAERQFVEGQAVSSVQAVVGRLAAAGYSDLPQEQIEAMLSARQKAFRRQWNAEIRTRQVWDNMGVGGRD